jgi:hypothetical protein
MGAALLLGVSVSGLAWADSAIQLRTEGREIQGLSWDRGAARVELQKSGGEFQPVAIMPGTFGRAEAGWVLSGPAGELAATTEVQKQVGFELRIPVTAPSMKITLRAVSAEGDLEPGKLVIEVADFGRLKQGAEASTQSGGLRFGLGLASQSYEEARAPSTSQISLNARAAYQYPLSIRFAAQAEGYLDLLPLKKEASYSFRFANLGAGLVYLPGWLADPWVLSIGAGARYTTMLVAKDNPLIQVGFSNAIGPQLQPALARRLGGDREIAGYARYALLSGLDHEIGGGLEYGWGISRAGGNFSVSADYSSLKLTVSSVAISHRQIAVALHYRF